MSVLRKLFLVTVLTLLALPAPGIPAEEKSLVLIYQGDFKGYVEGCG